MTEVSSERSWWGNPHYKDLYFLIDYFIYVVEAWGGDSGCTYLQSLPPSPSLHY